MLKVHLIHYLWINYGHEKYGEMALQAIYHRGFDTHDIVHHLWFVNILNQWIKCTL